MNSGVSDGRPTVGRRRRSCLLVVYNCARRADYLDFHIEKGNELSIRSGQ